MSEQKHETLVSVVALSYNQENTVIETLNSIKAQSYQDIELIVSDDNSKDGTLVLVSSWLKTNGHRFAKTRLVTSDVNTGVCGNLDRGIKASSGSWIKTIACDDLLDKDAVKIFLSYALSGKHALVFSQMSIFKDVAGGSELNRMYLGQDEIDLIKGEISKLKREVLSRNFLPAPSSFYSKDLLERVGGVDTSFKHLDDWPLWLRMLDQITSVGFIKRPLVFYRLNESSLSQNTNGQPIRSRLYADTRQFYKKYQSTQAGAFIKWHFLINNWRDRVVYEYMGNKYIFFLLLKPLQLLSPVFWCRLSRRMLRSLGRSLG